MKPLLHVLIVLTMVGFASASDNLASIPVEKLIDDLTLIDSQAPGLHGTAIVNGFIAEDKPLQFGGGVLGSPAPKVPPAMRELVRRGVAALPHLIEHLGDRRPTKLTLGKDFFMFREFHDEYDMRFRSTQMPYLPRYAKEKSFLSSYTIKVGDVCYALIGQIVNRNLLPVRYQPTAGLIINSPIESPELIDRVKKDWSGLDEKAHKESLLADAQYGEDLWVFGPALARLRFYYPADYLYSFLNDDIRKHIVEFEAKEQTNTKPGLH